jgi:hypothetical protein
MKFCEQTTIGHPTVLKYQNILDEMFLILDKEGCVLKDNSPFFNNNFNIIDGDKLEDFFCFDDARDLSSKNKSVDIIFAFDGLASKELQFVELKLRCKDKFYHLDKTSFRQKADSSKKAIGNHIPVAKKHLIVFEKSVLNQAKHFLYRINPVLGNDFVAVDVNELYIKFFN